MNKETQSIVNTLNNTLNGQPWFGRAVFEILQEVDEAKVHTKPNGTEHSLIELLWHMNTWAEFTLAGIENRSVDEIKKLKPPIGGILIRKFIHGRKEWTS